MSLTTSLTTALAGLNATQAGISVVAGNVANAHTAGYIAQTVTQVATAQGNTGDSVRVAAINRVLDQFVQTQLTTESAGKGYADLRASFYHRLQQLYGQPGTDTTLDSAFNNFTTAVQALSTSPNSTAAQGQTVAAAQSLAQQLNNAAANIQGLRTQADQGIASDVRQANDALQQIAQINQQLQANDPADSSTALLENQRDQEISQLAQLMSIRVVQGPNSQVAVFTSSGTQLVGTQAAQLNFNATGSITAAQQWNANPSKSGLGSLTLVAPGGGGIDLITSGAVGSGEFAAYFNMRDSVLVQAQSQVDAIAAQMSSALSDTTRAGTAETIGTQSGFATDIGGMSAGNSIHVTYTDGSNVQHSVSIIRVDDPTALPLSNAATSDPNDKVVGVDFSGGAASVATQLNAALGSTGLQFSNSSGTLLDILDNGPGTITVNAASTTTTATSLTGGSGALPLFADGSRQFTGAITAAGSQMTGYAGRIVVNSALVGDPSGLVNYQTSPQTQAGDATRPNFIYNQLVNSSGQYATATGLGGAASPFQGTLTAFMTQMVSMQSLAATNATSLQSGQDVVVNALQARFNSKSAVNIDSEMANLLALQNGYSANARVMSTVKAMLDTLMQMM